MEEFIHYLLTILFAVFVGGWFLTFITQENQTPNLASSTTGSIGTFSESPTFDATGTLLFADTNGVPAPYIGYTNGSNFYVTKFLVFDADSVCNGAPCSVPSEALSGESVQVTGTIDNEHVDVATLANTTS